MGTLDPRDQNEQKSLPRDPEAAKIGPGGGAGGVQMPPGAAKIGPWEVPRGPGDAKMIIQRLLWFAKRELGVPKTDPKGSKSRARSAAKFRADYGPFLDAIFDRLGVPK